MKYCQKCILPDTRPGIFLNKDGIVQMCWPHKKGYIDRLEREKNEFKKIVSDAKKINRL